MKTHYAAIDGGIVIGTRSSASRHIDGTGRFGPYLFAVAQDAHSIVVDSATGRTWTFDAGAVSYHGSRAAAVAAVRASRPQARARVVDVIVTPKRLRDGDPVAAADFEQHLRSPQRIADALTVPAAKGAL